MSGRIVGEVLKYAPADLTPLQKLVLVALAESAREDDRTARYGTSCDALADVCNSTPGAMKQTLYTLRHRGLIVGLNKPRRGLTQHYRLTPMNDDTRRAVHS